MTEYSVSSIKKTTNQVFDEVGKVVIGQKDVLKQIMISLLTDSHSILEGYPGLAKTLAVNTLARLLDLKFSRIQNTPDLMPSDITGTYVLDEEKGKRVFRFQPGPVFANIILSDEINRATPKTQSALLEAMQEKQVTVGNTTFKLDEPFFVLATQNPIEQEGSLALDQHVFVNGMLKTGKELLENRGELLMGSESGTKLYNIDSWTYSLNSKGEFEIMPCFLYTLPYKEEFIEITTRSRRKIKVTKNHPFLINEEGVIKWKKAEELTKQDYLVNPAKIPTFPSREILSHEKTISLMKQKAIDEIPFDKDFAFWIGFILSDGSIGDNCVEAVQKNYPRALERFAEVSKKYGFKGKIYERKKDGCKYCRIYSKPLVEYLKIRFSVHGGRDKEIPSWFLSWPEEMIKEFLRTFIGLESHFGKRRISFSQKSENNVNLISYMLLRFGISSWASHNERLSKLKIQGEDYEKYLDRIGVLGDRAKIYIGDNTKSIFRVVPIDRKSVLRIVNIFGMNSFHTLKYRKDITKRPWYGGYKRIKEGEIIMSRDSLRKLIDDMRKEIIFRKSDNFRGLMDGNPRRFSAHIGLPITTICGDLGISRNQVWNLYTKGTCNCQQQITSLMEAQYDAVILEAELLVRYFEGLLNEEICYEKIKEISYGSPEEMAFGLTVPGTKNYIGGFGACGINHNTYPLPEAQTDRFLLKIKVKYPSLDEEIRIAEKYTKALHDPDLKPIVSKQKLKELQKITRHVPIATDIKKYAVELVHKTRKKKDLIEYGASPRASIGLILSSKARALIEGRKHVSKEDIKTMAFPVLRLRIIPTFEAERSNLSTDDLIKQLVKKDD